MPSHRIRFTLHGSVYRFLLAAMCGLATLGFNVIPVQAQTPSGITSWYQNTSDTNAQLGTTAIRLGCSDIPNHCFDQIDMAASSQDVTQIYLSIALDSNTSVPYAAQFSQWSLTHPELISVGFDDLVNKMDDLQRSGIPLPGQIVDQTINNVKSGNPSLKFGATIFENELDSPLLKDPNLPLSTRTKFDYVHFYIHYRMNGANFATYIQQLKAMFPSAKLIAGVYAYDRIDYLPCQPGITTPCTVQQDAGLFQQLFLAQLSALGQQQVDQIEFSPGYFGLEDQWPGWFEPRMCNLSRLAECIANTKAMRQTVLQDLTTMFGPPGPLTSLSPRPLLFPVQDLNQTSGASGITLDNPGTAPLTISTISIGGAQALDFAQQNTCTSPIVPGGSCSINVTFTPSGQDKRDAQLIVTDNARRSPHSMDLQGVGAISTAPQVLLTPVSVDFKNQTVGTLSAVTDVVLKNVGGSGLAIASITLTGSNQSDYAQSNNCGTSLPSQASCTIALTFAPSAHNTESASVVITDNAVGSPHSISLSGLGTDPPAALAQLSATVLTFASQAVGTSSPPLTVTLSNSGNSALMIMGLSIAGTNRGDFSETSNCPSSVSAGGSCVLTLRFNPTSTGPRSAQFLISDNANGSPQAVTLSGAGSAPPEPAVSLAPNPVKFGSQTVKTTSPPATVTVTNTGTAALAISNVSLGGANAADFAVLSGCATSLQPTGTCTVTISFTPSTVGTPSALLQLTDNAAGGSQTVPVTGTAIAAVPVDFGISVTPTSAKIPAGQNAVFGLSVAASGGFGQAISFMCSPLPAAAVCSFSPSSVTPNASVAADATLTFTTQSRGALPPTHGRPNFLVVLWIAIYSAMAYVLFYFSLSKHCRRPSTTTNSPIFAFLTLLLIGFIYGCGGLTSISSPSSPSSPPSSQPPPGGPSGTPAGTYVISVTAQSGTLSHIITISVTVQ
jgi:hypothetical protein